MNTKNSLCIIPARSGSKRIPNKNIKTFINKPIIAYAIENAINSKQFDTIMVSTDSKAIADISNSYGAEIPFFRSITNSSDHAITADVLLEVIEQYSNLNIKYEYICCIYPCTPLLSLDSIINGMNLIRSNNYDMIMPIIKYSHPPQRALIIQNDNLHFIEKTNFKTRTQDLQEMYYDAGQFYCFSTESLLRLKQNIYTDGIIKSIIINNMFSQDVDTLDDWELAEIKYEVIHKVKYIDEYGIGYTGLNNKEIN